MTHFSPNWSDQDLKMQSLEVPLLLPHTTPKSKESSVWVHRAVQYEDWMGEKLPDSPPRMVTMVMRKSEASKDQTLTFTNRKGEEVSAEDSSGLYDLIFPPRVWMSDSLQERSMMYCAAEVAEGDVLVGGLGLGIYPQIVLWLNRPVRSITIVELNPDVIALVRPFLQECAKMHNATIHIVEDSIENFLQTTPQRFDTIYLDTWGDLHIKFLGYINYLIELSKKITTPNGQIQCWGYHFLCTDFLELAEVMEQYPENWDRLETEDNAALQQYLAWRKARTKKPSAKTVRATAAKFAHETIDATPMPLYIDMPRSRWLREQR